MTDRRFVFGPLPSRRLGRSLGVDPIPFKTCNWNCVYCQLGRSAPLQAERREWTPTDQVIGEIEEALRWGPRPDFVTFGGSGEPTLHTGLGRMIRAAVALGARVAVLTNGSLLHLHEVRTALLPAHVVVPSLDAGSPEVYRAVDRAWPEPSFVTYLHGLARFRQVYRGRLLVEVMLVRGLNDSEEALHDLARALARIRPDEVHVNTPVRPGAEAFAVAPDPERVKRAEELLGAHAVRGATSSEAPADPVEVAQRHPLADDALPEEARQALAGSPLVKRVERDGHQFWVCAQGRFAEPAPAPSL